MAKIFEGTIRARMGFNNRLNGILSLWRYCDEMRALGSEFDFSITWPITDLVPGAYSDVMLNPMKIRQTETKYKVGWSLWFPVDNNIDFSVIQKYPDHVIHKHYEHINPDLIKAYLPYYDRVQFHPNIIQKTRSITLEKNTVGIHCREAPDWTQAGRSLGLDKYFSEIDKLDKTTPLYIVTHSDKTTDRFIKRYGSRVQVQPQKDYDSQTPNQLQNSIVDLLVLSKCSKLIGDHASSFLAGAWWFGKCKSNVIRIPK